MYKLVALSALFAVAAANPGLGISGLSHTQRLQSHIPIGIGHGIGLGIGGGLGGGLGGIGGGIGGYGLGGGIGLGRGIGLGIGGLGGGLGLRGGLGLGGGLGGYGLGGGIGLGRGIGLGEELWDMVLGEESVWDVESVLEEELEEESLVKFLHLH